MVLAASFGCGGAPGPSARSGEPPPPAPSASATSEHVAGCDAPSAGDPERRKFADEVASRASRAASSARARLSDARKRGVEPSCHSDTLSRADVTVRAVDVARRALVDALAAGDGDAASRRAVELSYLCVRAARIADESFGCP